MTKLRILCYIYKDDAAITGFPKDVTIEDSTEYIKALGGSLSNKLRTDVINGINDNF